MKDKPGINNTSFELIFSKGRRKGMTDTYHKHFMKIISNPRKQYKLIRVKSRLRVSFIGYSYNIKVM